MAQLVLDPDASDYIDSLHRTQPRVADRIEDALDALEDDPTSDTHRRHRLQATDGRIIWGFAISGHMILWHEEPETTRVIHVGPNDLL